MLAYLTVQCILPYSHFITKVSHCNTCNSVCLENSVLTDVNFHPLEVVYHYRQPQHQVGENYLYLFNLNKNI